MHPAREFKEPVGNWGHNRVEEVSERRHVGLTQARKSLGAKAVCIQPLIFKEPVGHWNHNRVEEVSERCHLGLTQARKSLVLNQHASGP